MKCHEKQQTLDFRVFINKCLLNSTNNMFWLILHVFTGTTKIVAKMRLYLKRNQIFKQKNNTFFMINKHKLCNLWNFCSYFLIRFSNYTPLLQRIGNLGPPNSMWTNETSSDISENNWLLNNIIAEQFAVHWARRLRFHISTNASLDD